MSTVVKMLFGGVVFVTVSMTAHAQTYYYYPTSVPAAPSVTPVPPSPRPATGNGRGEIRLSGTRIRRSIIRLRIRCRHLRRIILRSILNRRIKLRSNQTSCRSCRSLRLQYATSDAAPAAAGGAVAGDPYGFVGWLNATRAAYGLSAVGYDANLSNWAAMNNDQQAARGMGHFVMGPARRQNSAMGAFANIGSMWMNSPAHRAALLDPTISAIGIAGLGAYWTFNAY